MKIEASEKREVTYTLTLTEQEASDLKVLAGYDNTIPKAIRKVRGSGRETREDSERIERLLPVLYETLGPLVIAHLES